MKFSRRNKSTHGALRLFACLCLFSGLTLASYAQDAPEGEAAAAAPKKTVKKNALPQYEMKEVSGNVYDAATKQPLAGVRVQALGNTRYTAMTDGDGAYTIKVPVFTTTLYVYVAEYNATQIAIKGASGQDAYLYNGLVRPLYADGTEIHGNHAATIEGTSSLTIENDIENTLNSSVRTISRGGMPAQGAVMFMNGLNSLNTNAQPLVVIDGVLQDMQFDRTALHDGFINNVFNIIDPEDIETVEVLQNGTAQYGARGANGVLKITTRRGKSMVTRIKIRAFAGFETAPEQTKVMDATQYRSYVSEFLGTTTNAERLSASNVAFLNEDPNYLFYPVYHNNTDWQKDLYRTAFTQNYKVGVEGGDDVAMYNLTLGYTKGQATLKNNDFNRLNIRFNTDVSMFRNMTAAMDIAYARNAYNILDNGWAESYEQRNISSPNVLGTIQSPFISPYAYYVLYSDGALNLAHADNIYSGRTYTDANNPYAFASSYGYEGLVNPYWILQNGEGNNKNYQEQTQFTLNLAPRYTFNRYLYIENRFSYILNRSNEKYMLPNDGTPSKTVEGLGEVKSVLKSQFAKETTLFNDLHVNWNRHYAQHHINLLGGFRFESYSYGASNAAGYNNGNDKLPNMAYSLQYKDYGGANDSWKNLTYYVNANYDYMQKYYANVTMSLAASSRFGKEAEEGLKMFGVAWGFFGSLQLGWLMSSEDWFDVDGIDYLKFTMGFDRNGNDAVDYFATRTYFANRKFLDKATGLVLANIENPKIQWETTNRFNFGFQSNFFRNRLALGFTFYAAKTKNLLTQKAVSDVTGLATMWDNDGALKNRGLELNVNAVAVNVKDWKWQLGFGLGHYKNEITDLPTSSLNYITTYALDANGNKVESTANQIHGTLNSIYGTNNILTAVGHAAGVFYGYKTAGVFSTDAEAASAGLYGYLRYPTGLSSSPYRNFKAGDVHFVDQNGDGWISEADMVEIGDPNPVIYGNFYTNLSWKHLTLDVVFKYSLGNDIYNYQRSQLESANNIWNQTTAICNRWRYEGQVTDVPRTMATTNDEWVNNERFSDRWIEDGSYLKLKKVRLTYQVPLKLTWLQGLAIWGEANNVFTLTKYLGSDPEVSCNNSVLYQGIDTGMLVSNRNFNFGVTINL